MEKESNNTTTILPVSASLHKTNHKDFSVLSPEIPWDGYFMWWTIGLFFFCLHFPLWLGGLPSVTLIMDQPVLEPEAEAVTLLLIQTIELLGALALLRYTMKTEYDLGSFFHSTKFSKERNWVQAAALGFGILLLFVVFTSFFADTLIGPKFVNNPILKETLSSGGSIAKTACFLLYCFVAPLLDEIIYRGFLLTCFTSMMKWPQAVVLSSFIFSCANFSSGNTPQLLALGWVLGCSYCWSGNLLSSISVHALYNAVTLLLAILN